LLQHRDLHEGNLCIRQIEDLEARDESRPLARFGYSGLDITILDYGLSRAEDPTTDEDAPVAYDLEKDLSLFTSTHADQCKVYRQMRSYLLRGDRKWLAVSAHNQSYAKGVDGNPITWDTYAPYTNVLWLAYLYEYMTANFVGAKQELNVFKKETTELWTHLNPAAKPSIPCFGSAGDVVRFAVEAGWILEEQLMGDGSTFLAEREDSIIVSLDGEGDEGSLAKLRRSPRRRQQV
jgi:serine/threonine-protein kinase haspin